MPKTKNKESIARDILTIDCPNNEDDVLAKIEEDHPAGEWQNNNW